MIVWNKTAINLWNVFMLWSGYIFKTRKIKHYTAYVVKRSLFIGFTNEFGKSWDWEHMTHVNLKFNLIQIFKTLQNNGRKKQNTFERWTTDITYISKENLRSCVSEKLHETFLIPTPCAKIAWRGSQAGTVVHLQLHEM